MTKDEAIATLEAIKQFGIGKWIFDKEEIEAFDLAIESLSAEADGDTIRRQDAIECLPNGFCYDQDDCVEAIKNIPSADRPSGE